MRLFIIYNDETGTRKTSRITVNVSTTSQLLKLIASKIQYSKNCLIVTLKHQLSNFRIIDGWNISDYPIKNGSKLQIKINQQLIKANSPQFSTLQKIQQSSQLDLENQQNQLHSDKQNLQLSFISQNGQYDWNKYFDQSLQLFLNAVRSGNLEKVAEVIKTYPQAPNQSQVNLQQIYQKKVNYLLNQLGECGRNSLHWAIHIKNIDIMNFLLIKCCSLSVQTIDGYSPLQLAIQMRFQSGVNILLDYPKLDINQQTIKGSALHTAVETQNLSITKKLLNLGIQRSLINNQGKTAIQICKNSKISKLISQHKQRKSSYEETHYILKGVLFKVSSITYSLKKRELIVNPFTGQMKIIDGKNTESTIHIISISQVKMIKQYGWLMNKKMFYFYIYQTQNDKKLTFAVKHKQIAERWIYNIKTVILYWKNKEKQMANNLKKIKSQQQLIQFLDDDKNEIRHHKRKINEKNKNKQNSNRISIMDLKVIDQQQQKKQKLISQNIKYDKDDKNLTILSSSQNTAGTSKLQLIEQFNESICNNDEDRQDRLRDSEIMLGSILGQVNQLHSNISSHVKQRTTFNNADLINQSARSSTTISLGTVNNNPQAKIQMFQIKEQQLKQSIFQQNQTEDFFKPSFKNFRIIRQLGKGSFGRVFLAKHQRTNKVYALKVLNKKVLQKKKQMKYAISQANILKRVNSNFIVKLHYSFQTPNNLYLALDYCPNSDLCQLLNQKQSLTQKSARFILAQLLEALQSLHSLGIIYRDLKPQNILMKDDGYISLADFGLSRQNTFSKSFCGSPAYLSPEMLDKKGVGLQNDIYGLGCVFYQMLTGQPPYFDQELEQLFNNIRNGKLKFPSDVSKQAKSLAIGLLERNIVKRLGVQDKNEIRNHPFFKNFDWQQLRQKKMNPPIQLISEKKLPFQLQKVENHGFTDQDYQIRNSYANRVKNFTFVRQQDLQQIRQSFLEH